LDMSRAATKPLETEIQRLSSRITSIQKQIDRGVQNMKILEEDVKDRSGKVSASYTVMSIKTREMYKKLRAEPLWVSLLKYEQLGESRRELAYRQESSDRDKQIIINLVSEIGRLEADKKKLETEKIKLTQLQVDLDKQNAFFQGEVKKAKEYQTDLTGKIATLTARQQAILAEKQGTFQTTVTIQIQDRTTILDSLRHLQLFLSEHLILKE